MSVKRTWTEIGKEETEGHQDRIGKILDSLDWEPLITGKQYPMMPAHGVMESIKQLRIPKVSHIAIGCHEMAPFGLYGIRGHYKNGMAEIFLLDRGHDILVIASDLHSQ